MINNPPVSAGDTGLIPGWEDPLEKEMATDCGILAWKISWTEEPSGYSPWDFKRVSHDLVTEHTHMKIIIIVYTYSGGLKCIFSMEWETGNPGLLHTQTFHISHPAIGSSLPACGNFPSFSLKDLQYFFSLPLVPALYSSLSPFSHCLPLSLTKGW